MDDNKRSLLLSDRWTIGRSDAFLGLSAQKSTYLRYTLGATHDPL